MENSPAINLINKIFATKEVVDSFGNSHKLNSNVDLAEGDFLQKLITSNNFSRSIEIGCAYGISSLFISDVINKNKGTHLIVDPNQSTDWKGIGFQNLKKSGLTNFRIIEKPSEVALPELYITNETFDFAFIDGWHTFDHTLIDFFYINKMLKPGGVVVIDDIGMIGLNKLARFIYKYPCYEYAGSVKVALSNKRVMFGALKFIIRLFAKCLPLKLRNEIFSDNLLKSNSSLGLNSSMIAFKKTSKDERPWNWHEKF